MPKSKPRLINHNAISSLLVSNGFYQIIKHVTAGWFHESGIIIYYSRLSFGVGYIVRHKLEYFEVKNETELEELIKHFKTNKLI